MYIGWWSAGVTSAVACKFLIDEYGADNVILFYFHIGTSHPDNARFMADCEKWYGVKINVVSSTKYVDQFDVIESTGWVNGPGGARCTTELKKNVRLKIQSELSHDGQCFGFEFSKKEINRALRFQDQYPETNPTFPLIERGMSKPECLSYLNRNNIAEPTMYKLGYPNNNCIGCVKGGKGYWNKIRLDFPSTFDRMAELERDVNASCINGTYLDELDDSAGRDLKIIMPDCGSFCEIKYTEIPHKNLDIVEMVPFLIKCKSLILRIDGSDHGVFGRSIIQYLGDPVGHSDGVIFYDCGVSLSCGT